MPKMNWVQMHPGWYACATACGVLLGHTAWFAVVGPAEGTLLMAFYMYSVLGGPISVFICMWAMQRLMRLFEEGVWRGGLVLLALGGEYAVAGLPSRVPTGLALALAVKTYVDAARALDNQNALESL